VLRKFPIRRRSSGGLNQADRSIDLGTPCSPGALDLLISQDWLIGDFCFFALEACAWV